MNRVVHFEIHATDVEAMKKFYSEVFGWEARQMGSQYGNYVLLMSGPGMDSLDELPKNPGINGGMMKRNAPKAPADAGPNAFVCTIGVDDVDAMMKKVADNGGSIHMDKMVVPGVGDLAYCADPDGNVFGIIKPIRP